MVDAKPAVMLYDGQCGFCIAAVEVGRCHVMFPTAGAVPNPGVVWLPWQGAEVAPQVRRRAQGEVVLLSPDGTRVWGGVDAVAVLLLNSPNARWWVLGSLLRRPGLRQLGAGVYRWVARNRARIPVLRPGPWCRETLAARSVDRAH